MRSRSDGAAWSTDVVARSDGAGRAESALDEGRRSGRVDGDRLHRALEAGRMGTWEFDPETGAVRWSPTLEEIHGIPSGSFAGTFAAYLDDVHPDDLARVRRTMERAVSRKAARHHLQYRIIRPDGEVRWLEAHGRFDTDAGETPGRLVGVCSDITERKDIEAHRDLAIRRNRKLLSITGAIADAVTPAQVQEAVVDQVSDALGATSAALWLMGGNARVATLVRSRGYREVAKAAVRTLELDSELRIPVLDAMRSGQPLWIDSKGELLAAYPHLEPIVSPGRDYRIACLPIMSHGAVVGGLGLTFEEAPPLSTDERAFITLVAGYCVQALERLRLLANERESRARAEGAAARMELLSRASRRIAEVGPSVPDLLATVVSEVVSDFADAAGVLVVSETGDHSDVSAVGHREAEGTALMERLFGGGGPGPAGKLAQSVIETGESVFVPVVDITLLTGHEHRFFREFAGGFAGASVVVVPVRTSGEIIGALGAVRMEGAHRFGEADRDLLEELGARTALAIERGRLHQSETDARDRAELLYRLAAGVIGADRLEQLFDTAMDGLESAVGAQRSSILSTDAEGVMRFQGWRNLSEAYRAAVEGHSPWLPTDPEPGPVGVSDVETDPTLAPLLPVLRAEKIRAVWFFPLVSGRELIGKCVVYFPEPRVLEEHEVAMGQAIADHIAAAVARFAAIAELREAVHFNEMFTGMLGHDLRNPLGSIMTAAQLAVLRSSEDRLTVPLTRILTAGARMARMIDQLLDFTRVRAGAGIPIDPGTANLATIAREVIEELDDTHPEWSIELSRFGDTRGTWDVDRLSQVFSNLVANAVQHGIPEHGATVRIDGTAPDQVVVEVHNMGAIPATRIPHMFEAMSGEERARARSGGLGLGLFISRQILRAHGGGIEVASSEEAGTTFTVQLPRHCGLDRGG